MKKHIFTAFCASLFVFSLLISSVGVVRADDTVFNTDISVGMNSSEVANLQSWLIEHGYDIPSVSTGGVSKGYFGAQTKLAVIRYQQANGLPQTGFVGPMTRGKMNKTVSGSAFNIISPNGSESWKTGTTQTIRWNAPSFIRATYVDINLVPYYQPCTGQVCPMGAQNMMYPYRAPYQIAKNISIDTHSYSWNVGEYVVLPCTTDGGPCPSHASIPDGRYTIQICQTSINGEATSICTSSRAPFTIYSGTSTVDQQSVTVLSPNGGEVLSANSFRKISWSTDGLDVNGKVDIYLDADAYPAPVCIKAPCGPFFTTKYTLDKNIPVSTRYNWIVATDIVNNPIPAGNYYMKVCVAGTEICDRSDSSFSIVNDNRNTGNTITVVSPNGGESLPGGSVKTISWNYKNMNQNSRVDIYDLALDSCPNYNSITIAQCKMKEIVLDKNIPANTVYNWIVATDINNNHIDATQNFIKVCVANTSDCDTSDTYFNMIYATAY